MITNGIIIDKRFSKINTPELAEAVLHVYCLAGTCTFTYNDRQYEMHPHDEVSVQAAHWRDISMSDDFDAKMFYITLPLSREAMVADRYFAQYVIVRYANPIIHLTGMERQRCFQCFLDVEASEHSSNQLYSRDIQRNIVERFFMELNDILVAHQDMQEPQFSTQMGRVMRRFVELIPENCVVHRDVAWYASELCVSRKYLTQVSQTVSMRPPIFWINLFTIRQISAMLANPDLTIAQVAEHFNFSSQAYFSRYVKKYIGGGKTPKEGGVNLTRHKDSCFLY